MSDTPRKRPILCRLGVHSSICRESAMFSSADRCNHCGGWLDEGAGVHVERERELWSQTDGMSDSEAMRHVVRHFYGLFQP